MKKIKSLLLGLGKGVWSNRVKHLNFMLILITMSLSLFFSALLRDNGIVESLVLAALAGLLLFTVSICFRSTMYTKENADDKTNSDITKRVFYFFIVVIIWLYFTDSDSSIYSTLLKALGISICNYIYDYYFFIYKGMKIVAKRFVN